MTIKRKCKICGKDISNMHHKRKFCNNPDCQKKAQEIRHYKYLDNKINNSILDKVKKDME